MTAGAKERLVQITGSSEENIERAKELIETTIKRNASPDPFEVHNNSFVSNISQTTTETIKTVSPVREDLDSPPTHKSEPKIETTFEPKSHSFIVEVNSDVIHLSTTNYELGVRAQQLLKQSFLLETTVKSTEQEVQNSEKRNSINDCNSGDELEKKVIPTPTPKEEVFAALDSVSKGFSNECKVNRIQRSSSQGTVPIGRTSLRFLSKSVGHDPTPKITYERQFLMECSQNSLSRGRPSVEIMAKIYQKTPEIIRKHYDSGETTNNSTPLHKSQSFTQSFTQSRVLVVDDWK